MASYKAGIVIDADVTKAAKAMKQLTSSVEQMSRKVDKNLNVAFGKNALRLSDSLLSKLKYAAAGLTVLGAASVKMAADFQVAKKSMEVLTGSVEKAQKHLSDLERFAATTPFDFAGLVDASKRLQAYGFQAEAVIPILQNVGDASAALGLGQEGIDRLTLALGQIAVKGKLTAEEMRQISETGIAGWQMLADYTGKSVGEIQALTTKGAISSQMALEALFTGMRDRFGGIMQASSKEIIYQWSNIRDAIESIMRGIGDSITEGLDLKTKMSSASDYLTALAYTIKTSGVQKAFEELVPPELTGALAAVATAITVILIPALMKLGVAMLAAGGPFTAVAAVAAAAAYVIVTHWEDLADAFDDIKRRLGQFFDWLSSKGEEAAVRVGKVADNVEMDFSGIFSGEGSEVRGGLNLTKKDSSRPSIAEKVKEIMGELSKGLKIETDPTKFLAGSVAELGKAQASAAATKAAAREAEKAAKEAIKLDAENADRVLKRIEQQKEAAKELAEIYERADREYLSGLSWENSQGLLSNSDYLDILKTKIEDLGLATKNVFNWTDKDKAFFSTYQNVGSQEFSKALDLIKNRYESGTISVAQYKATLEQLKQQYADMPLVVKMADEALTALNNTMNKYPTAAQQASAAWDSAKEALYNFPTGIGSAFESAIRGTESLSDAMLGLLQDIGAVVAKALIMRALFGGGSGGGLLGGLFGAMHEGGPVGAFSGVRAVDPGVFSNAPRYHSGGVAGLAPDEVPAILQAGEVVIPKGARRSGGVAAETGDTYNITIQAVDSQSFAKMLEKGKGTLENLIVNGIQRGGSLRSAIKGATS